MGLTRENKKLFICPEESMNTAGICRFGLPAAISSSGGGTCILLLAKPSPPATLRPQVRVAGPLLSFEGQHLAQTWPFYQHWFRDGHSRGRPPKVTVLFLSVHSLPDQCLYPLHPNSHGWPSSGLAPGKYSSTGFPGNQGANQMSIPPSITCNIPLNPKTRPAYLILSAVHHTLGCHSRTLL